MPKNQIQRVIYAVLTVIVTVHAFAFFSQLFFIQPLIRTIFKLIFVRKNQKIVVE